MGLGSLTTVSLAEAREKAMNARKLLADGIDPKTARQQSQVTQSTFGEVATDFIDGHEDGWKNQKHVQQWRNTLATYAKSIWDKPVADVNVEDVVQILRPIWSTKHETASRLRGRIERVLDTIDSSMPGGHSVITIDNLRVPADQMLGESGEGFKYAQIRLAPARLTHCMRWHGAATRAHEIATDYACRRQAFGKPLVDHEGVGFMLAQNRIDLKHTELMIDWCADVLDTGSLGTVESSMTKCHVGETLFQIADRCVQVMGGTGVSRDTIVEQVFREIRAFRIYDGPTEVHKWSLAKKIKREWREANDAVQSA